MKVTPATPLPNCTIIRTFDRIHGTLNIGTGETKENSRETVTEACSVPLFGKETKRGVCRACAKGWEVPDNRFANAAERERALLRSLGEE
jgi:hypothetical protein